MATSTGKTIGLIALIFLILLFFMHIVPGLFGIIFNPSPFSHISVLSNIGNFMHTNYGFPPSWFAFQIVPLGLLALWIAVILWVYRDAEKRNMNGVLWGLLVFVGNIIGLIIYLILRNEETFRSSPAPSVSVPGSGLCPSCSVQVQPGFAFCPHCGSKVEAECPKCKKPVSGKWKLCPFCGERLAEPATKVEE